MWLSKFHSSIQDLRHSHANTKQCSVGTGFVFTAEPPGFPDQSSNLGSFHSIYDSSRYSFLFTKNDSGAGS